MVRAHSNTDRGAPSRLVRGREQEFAFPTSSQVMLMLLVGGPHFKSLCQDFPSGPVAKTSKAGDLGF